MRQAETAFSEIVAERLKELDTTPYAIEKLHGLPSDAVRNVLRGGKKAGPPLYHAQAICDALGLELYFGPRRGPATIEQVQLDSTDFASIPVHQAMLAAGGGRINDTEDRVGYLAFRRDWLRQIGVSVADAVLARAEGDSMLPGIRDKDLLLIDRARNELPTKLRGAKDTRPAPIYAVLVDGEARVKRIERAPGNTLALLSDNPAYPPDFRPLGAVTPIGRVMWWAHTNHE